MPIDTRICLKVLKCIAIDGFLVQWARYLLLHPVGNENGRYRLFRVCSDCRPWWSQCWPWGPGIVPLFPVTGQTLGEANVCAGNREGINGVVAVVGSRLFARVTKDVVQRPEPAQLRRYPAAHRLHPLLCPFRPFSAPEALQCTNRLAGRIAGVRQLAIGKIVRDACCQESPHLAPAHAVLPRALAHGVEPVAHVMPPLLLMAKVFIGGAVALYHILVPAAKGFVPEAVVERP